ncbi:MAG TPA: glycoside hydrolase family 44 protein [Thermoanaerobaculia bacterium]
MPKPLESPFQRVALAGSWILVLAFPVRAQNPPVTVSIDASADRAAISPLIYGVAYGTPSTLSDLNVPVNRLGGNNTSRYNWQANADNRGNDWYFESIPYASAAVGEVGDSFISESEASGAQPMVTIPMVGWVAKVGPGRSKLASFSIAKYGPQSGNDWQWFPDAGNGLHLNGSLVAGNDPNDSGVPADSLFQKGWAQHLFAAWGPAYATGLAFYILDNEPSIWHATHRDVHPTGATMQEIRDKIVDYATTIKAVDPSALVVGPEEWGWSGYFFSGYDQQYGSLHGWSVLPDRASHGGADYLPWLLTQIQQASTSAGKRLLDYFSVHYYPQSGEFSNDTSSATQLLRNRSTRSLWDPAYVDESWINDTVELIPRLRGWVAADYSGTKTAITEYNWGAEGHINGATTQADILGIFGREGLDLATRWTTPDPSTPTYKAIRLYRNYDGHLSTFGDVHVRAIAPDPDTLSAFAAERRSDGALTVMVVHKRMSGGTPVTLSLAGFNAKGGVQVWQLTAANSITRLADLTVSSNTVSTSVPPQSITLFVIPASAGRSFFAVSPCRAVDTRGPAGSAGAPALPSGGNRTFRLVGLCGVSPTAVAVSLNLTVTSPTSAGSLTLSPDGSTLPPTNSVSFRPGQTRANNSVISLGAAGGVTLHAALPSGSVQVIVDVNGYFE